MATTTHTAAPTVLQCAVFTDSGLSLFEFGRLPGAERPPIGALVVAHRYASALLLEREAASSSPAPLTPPAPLSPPVPPPISALGGGGRFLAVAREGATSCAVLTTGGLGDAVLGAAVARHILSAFSEAFSEKLAAGAAEAPAVDRAAFAEFSFRITGALAQCARAVLVGLVREDPTILYALLAFDAGVAGRGTPLQISVLRSADGGGDASGGADEVALLASLAPLMRAASACALEAFAPNCDTSDLSVDIDTPGAYLLCAERVGAGALLFVSCGAIGPALSPPPLRARPPALRPAVRLLRGICDALLMERE
jgi:hypothetical protein